MRSHLPGQGGGSRAANPRPARSTDPAANPWLAIPAADYEGHMASPAVDQFAFLSGVLRDAIAEFRPRSLAVLGCATGNGFEHLWDLPLERVVGIDFHPGYLEILRARHAARIPTLELRCADLSAADAAGPLDFGPGAFDFISAALLFEYVDPAIVLSRAARWLRPGGVLQWVLQMPAASGAPITKTEFSSLKRLEPLMKLVDPGRLADVAAASGLPEIRERAVTLATGKAFHLGVCRRAR